MWESGVVLWVERSSYVGVGCSSVGSAFVLCLSGMYSVGRAIFLFGNGCSSVGRPLV